MTNAFATAYGVPRDRNVIMSRKCCCAIDPRKSGQRPGAISTGLSGSIPIRRSSQQSYQHPRCVPHYMGISRQLSAAPFSRIQIWFPALDGYNSGRYRFRPAAQFNTTPIESLLPPTGSRNRNFFPSPLTAYSTFTGTTVDGF